MNNQRITASPADNDVDEIVAETVDIHLERMSDGLVWFALYRKGVESRLSFWIQARSKNELQVSAYWEGEPWPDVKNEIVKWFPVEGDPGDDED